MRISRLRKIRSRISRQSPTLFCSLGFRCFWSVWEQNIGVKSCLCVFVYTIFSSLFVVKIFTYAIHIWIKRRLCCSHSEFLCSYLFERSAVKRLCWKIQQSLHTSPLWGLPTLQHCNYICLRLVLRLMCQSHLEFVGENGTVVINTLLGQQGKHTNTHRLCTHSPERVQLYLFSCWGRGCCPLWDLGITVVCRRVDLWALNCISRVYVYLCVAPRLGASVTVWGINLLTSASSSFFHYRWSLMSGRSGSEGKWWRKMPEFYSVF